MEARRTEQMWRVSARVRGRVQNVGFRYFVRTAASRLHVTGWVRNEPDGSVSVVAEGQLLKLQQLINALYTGPSLACVKSVELRWDDEMEHFEDFSIIL